MSFCRRMPPNRRSRTNELPFEPMKRNSITLITGIVLVIIMACLLFTFQVRQTEAKVVTTFGKYSRSINGLTDAGLKFRLPWPIQKIYEFDNRIRTFERKFDQTFTKDQISLIISVYVGWRIAEPKIFLESFNADINRAEQSLEQLVRNAKSGVIGQTAFSDLISTNQADLKFDQVEKQMLDAIQTQVLRNYGIQVEVLGIKQVELPESVTSTVFERMKAERQRLVSKYESGGHQDRRRGGDQSGRILRDVQEGTGPRRVLVSTQGARALAQGAFQPDPRSADRAVQPAEWRAEPRLNQFHFPKVAPRDEQRSSTPGTRAGRRRVGQICRRSRAAGECRRLRRASFVGGPPQQLQHCEAAHGRAGDYFCRVAHFYRQTEPGRDHSALRQAGGRRQRAIAQARSALGVAVSD